MIRERGSGREMRGDREMEDIFRICLDMMLDLERAGAKY
jgi:hypothetical protein